MIVLGIFLSVAVWQDAHSRSVKGWVYWLFGILGILLCILQKRDPIMTGSSAAIGLFLLLLSRLSGAIGEGDGLFFLVSGLFLDPGQNLFLLLSGVFLCGVFSLTLITLSFGKSKSLRKMRIPFLPFLLPAGFWLIVL